MNAHRLTTRAAVFAASALAAASVAAGAGGATGPATTEPVQVYPFGITIQDAAVKLEHHAIPFDSFTQFRIRNATRHNRTFSIGGQTVTVRAKGGRILIIQFSARGKYPFTSRGPKGTKTFRGAIPVI
jgi:hypothetical protein